MCRFHFFADAYADSCISPNADADPDADSYLLADADAYSTFLYLNLV